MDDIIRNRAAARTENRTETKEQNKRNIWGHWGTAAAAVENTLIWNECGVRSQKAADKDIWCYCHALKEALQTPGGACAATAQCCSSVIELKSVVFCSSFNLVPFLFFSFLLFYASFHFIFIFCFLSSWPLFVLLSLLSLTTSCSLSHPPSLFRSPFLSFLLSWFCAHAPFLKSSGESYCGKFPARRLLCGSLVSQHRCWGSNLDCICDTCVPHNSCTETQNPDEN